MLRPYSDREPRLPARPRRREALRAAAGPRARGGRSGRGARRAPRPRGGARRHAATGPAGAAGASGGAAGRAPAPGGARARGRAGAVRGGRRAAASGPRGRRRGRCGPRDSAAGATGRVAAMGRGRRAPQGGTRSHPGPGRVGRPHHMTSGDDVQLVTFKVAGQDFAFNIFQVERILRYEAPAPLPKAPDFLEVVVDAVTEVLQVAATEVTAPPNIVKGLAAEYITGIVVKDGRTVIALNTARLFNSKEKLAIESALQETAKP